MPFFCACWPSANRWPTISRFFATALRLITDLERIGDEAVNIGERAVQEDGEAKRLVRAELASMADAARDMLHGALEALVQWDDCGADRVLGCDDAVDQTCASVIATMTAHMTQHPGEIQAGLRVIRVAKYLERIADHATNVAEQVIFMVRADDVRHGHWKENGSSAVPRPAHGPFSPRAKGR